MLLFLECLPKCLVLSSLELRIREGTEDTREKMGRRKVRLMNFNPLSC